MMRYFIVLCALIFIGALIAAGILEQQHGNPEPTPQPSSAPSPSYEPYIGLDKIEPRTLQRFPTQNGLYYNTADPPQKEKDNEDQPEPEPPVVPEAPKKVEPPVDWKKVAGLKVTVWKDAEIFIGYPAQDPKEKGSRDRLPPWYVWKSVGVVTEWRTPEDWAYALSKRPRYYIAATWPSGHWKWGPLDLRIGETTHVDFGDGTKELKSTRQREPDKPARGLDTPGLREKATPSVKTESREDPRQGGLALIDLNGRQYIQGTDGNAYSPLTREPMLIKVKLAPRDPK